MTPAKDMFHESPRSRPGAALLMILGLVFVMSLVLSAFLGLVEQQLKLKGLYQDNDELRVQAYAALETTLAVLNMFAETDKGLFSPAQGWDHPLYFASLEPHAVTLEDNTGIKSLDYPDEEEEDADARQARLDALSPEERARAERLAERRPREIFELPPLPFPHGIKVDIQITDETGLIPLTAAYAEAISEVFQKLDISEMQARELVDCLLDWIDTDDDMRPNGAEQNYYDTLTPAVIVPNRALQSLDELRYIKEFGEVFFNPDGQPNEKWIKLRGMVTLHSHSKINLNTAPVGVLEIFDERDDLDAQTVVDHRNGSDGIAGTLDDKLIRELSDVNVSKSGGEEASTGANESVTGTGSLAHLLGTNCQLLRVRITAHRGDSRFILSLLVSLSGTTTQQTSSEGQSQAAQLPSAASSSSKSNFSIKLLQENREIE